MTLFTHTDFEFIPEEVAIVYKNFTDKKSVFGWILFHEDGTYAGSYVVEHEKYPDKVALKEMLSGLAYELTIHRDTILKLKKKGETTDDRPKN